MSNSTNNDKETKETLNAETILEVAGEGGRISLIHLSGMGEGDLSKYFIKTNEIALYDIMKDLDDNLNYIQSSKIVSTLEEAFFLLDRYPWTKLNPQYIHEDYRHIILHEMQKRNCNTYSLRKWKLL